MDRDAERTVLVADVDRVDMALGNLNEGARLGRTTNGNEGHCGDRSRSKGHGGAHERSP
jgi:hypothetical protein